MAGPANSTPPFFSVVIPVYNRGSLIRETLDSVRNQTHQDFEIIAVDDGSTDNSCQVIESLGDPRIRLIRQKNAGAQAARNAGIDAANGRYVALLDSDDLFVLEKLARVRQVLDAGDFDVVYSSFLVDRGVGRYMIRPTRPLRPAEDVGEYLFVHSGRIQTSAIVVRTGVARKVRFLPGLRRGQDYDFALRLHHEGVRAHFIDEPLYVWNDKTRANRVSLGPLRRHMEEWFEKSSSMMTQRARIGYRASVLSYELGWSKPFAVASYLAGGVFRAGIPLRNACQMALRAYLPAPAYRAIISGLFFAFGQKEKERGYSHAPLVKGREASRESVTLGES